MVLFRKLSVDVLNETQNYKVRDTEEPMIW